MRSLPLSAFLSCFACAPRAVVRAPASEPTSAPAGIDCGSIRNLRAALGLFPMVEATLELTDKDTQAKAWTQYVGPDRDALVCTVAAIRSDLLALYMTPPQGLPDAELRAIMNAEAFLKAAEPYHW